MGKVQVIAFSMEADDVTLRETIATAAGVLRDRLAPPTPVNDMPVYGVLADPSDHGDPELANPVSLQFGNDPEPPKKKPRGRQKAVKPKKAGAEEWIRDIANIMRSAKRPLSIPEIRLRLPDSRTQGRRSQDIGRQLKFAVTKDSAFVKAGPSQWYLREAMA